MSSPKALPALLATLLCIFLGSGKVSAADSPSAIPGTSGFSPKPPEQNSPGGKDVSDLFEKAAGRFSPFLGASPRERFGILEEALPLLDEALKASDERVVKDPRAVNFRTLTKLDSRFAEAWVWTDFRAVANGGRTTPRLPLPLSRTTIYTNATGLPKLEDPKVDSNTPVEVAQFSARAVGRAFSGLAGEGKKEFLDLAFGNAVQSLLESAMKRQDYSGLLTINPGDSLEEREKKVIVKAALDGVIGSIISHKGSFFLAAERPSGQLEIWEFKNRIRLRISREPTDARTRLNTGVELMTKVEFLQNDASDPLRRYVGGFWGTWGEFPAIGEMEITKDENWNVTFRSDLPFRHFHRLTLTEVEHALSRTTTTRMVASAEKALEAEELASDAHLTLINFFTAQGEFEKTHALAAKFLGAESLEPAISKRLATVLLSEVAFSRPNLAETVRTGIGFKYYEPMKGLNTEMPEMRRLPYPGRLGEKHFYGARPDLSSCIKAFEHLRKAEPANADLLFDLAVLKLFQSNRFRRPFEPGDDELERSVVNHLTEALALASKAPPKSGRNFSKLITDEPTFIPLQGQSAFENLLSKITGEDRRRAALSYRRKFQKQVDYFNAGY